MGVDGGRETIASLRRYLEELKESGVDELPRAVVPRGEMPVPTPEAAKPTAEPVAKLQGATTGEPLDDIRRDLGECVRCQLGSQRTNLVFGVGNPQARLVFIGEAPGRD
ncbi:uracil-DNA glycosylase, partial [bacterium]|nr:uracil-DNA glycosylase [bacterium]